MKKIWVVFGTTGEYSDRTEWPVMGFLSKTEAENWEHLCLHRAKELESGRRSKYSIIPSGSSRYDPDMKSDYTGTDYYTIEVPMFEDAIDTMITEANCATGDEKE